MNNTPPNLICNYKDCYKDLIDVAYVTFCCHIFCADHGTKLKADTAQGCYACKKELSEHQVTETNLHLSENIQSLMLAGHHPRTIMTIAKSALSFWAYQKKHETNILKRKMEYYREIANQNLKLKHESVKESDVKLSILMRTNEKLLKEKQDLILEIASIKQDMEQRTNKKVKLENDLF
ncbi:unnamed protein product [Diamesa tonsa]